MMTDPTPTTPITIGDRMIFLSRALSGIDERTLSDLYGQIATALTAADTINEQLDVLVGFATEINAKSASINEGIGGPGFSDLSLTTVRGILWSIYQLMRANRYGTPPPNSSGSIGSGDSIVVEGRRYALWAEPIAGADVVNDGIGLDPQSSWEGWSIYVQTSAPSCYISGEELDTNVWLDLSGSAIVTAAVDRQYPIVAYIKYSVSDPVSFDLTPSGVVSGYDYGTSGWPLASFWTVEENTSNPYVVITVLITVTLQFTPFDAAGATVAEYIIGGQGNTFDGVTTPRTFTLNPGNTFGALGGNGQLSFHVLVNPPG
jgi:hypothetical protein